MVQQLDNQLRTDEERTKALFLGFLTGVLGNEQTLSGEDGRPVQQTGQFVSVNTQTGSVSIEGQPISNQKTFQAVTGLSGTSLLILAALAYFVLK